MKKHELRALEALAKTLAVRVEDLLRMKDNPSARVTVSASGGYHQQASLADVIERHIADAPKGKVDPKLITSPASIVPVLPAPVPVAPVEPSE